MIAYKNKRKTWLSEEILNAVGGDPEVVSDAKLSTLDIVKRFFSKFSGDRIAPLFQTKRIAIMSEFAFPLTTVDSLSVQTCYLVLRLTSNHSVLGLVLLGNHWNGIPSFQCLPPTISRERWQKPTTDA